MQEIFISYARRDKEFVRKLHESLAAAGRDSWVDWEAIPPTTEWVREIFTAIERVQAVVLVLSPASIDSPMCTKEIEHAAQHNKRLIPVVICDVDPASVSDVVGRLQWLFFRPVDEFDAAFASLLSTIDTDIDWVRAHTRLLTRAIEWQGKKHDPSLLLRGNDLKEGESSLMRGTAKQPSPTPLQTEYVAAGRRADTRRQRRLIGAMAVGLVITSVLAVTAWRQRREAIAQRDSAISKQLAAYSELLLAQSPNLLDRAALLAIEAGRRAPGLEADRALRQTLAILPLMLSDQVQQQTNQVVAISPDGEQAAAGGDDGVVKIWRVASGESVAEFSLKTPITDLAFNPDGTMLAGASLGAVKLLLPGEHREKLLTRQETSSLHFSANGNMLITAGKNGVSVWSVSSGGRIREFPLNGGVDALAVSPDSRLVATGGAGNIIRVWDLKTGEQRMEGRLDAGPASQPLRLASRYSGVTALAFDKDGKYVASGGRDHKVRVWDVATGREVFRESQADSVDRVAFSPVEGLLASGGTDGAAHVWDLSKGVERFRLQHKDVVTAMMWDPVGNLLTVSLDGTARLWDMNSGDERARMFHPGGLDAAAIDSKGRRVVTASWETGLVRVWDVSKTGEAVQLPHDDMRDAVFSPDGKHIATVGGTYFAQLWGFPDGNLVAHLPHQDFVQEVAFSPDSKRVVTSGWDGAARVWDVDTGKMLADLHHDGRVTMAQFSPDGRLLVTGGWEDGSARIWDTATWQQVRRLMHTGLTESLRQISKPEGGVRFLAFAPNGTMLATSGQDGTVRLWNFQTGEEILRLAHNGFADSVCFSPDSRYLVSDSEKEVVVWSLPSGARVTTLDKGTDRFMVLLSLSPDGNLVLLGSQKQKGVQVRSMPDLKIVARLMQEHSVFAGRFNHDGSRLLTASQDTTARLWDTRTWQEVTRLNTNGIVYGARFSPDERFLVTASGEGMARVWLTSTRDLTVAACRRMARNLTPEEWRQYFGTEPGPPTCELSSRLH